MRRFLVLLALMPCLLSAQRSALRFEMIKGLSQNTVYSIYKDRQNFLWLATADGLNRYDGVEMKIYKPSIDGRPGTYMHRMIRTPLLEDQYQQIWFSSGAGLYSFNKQNDFFKPRFVINGSGWAIDPLLTEGATLWGANGSKGIVEYDIHSEKWKNYLPADIDPSGLVFSKCISDRERNFWGLKMNGLLYFHREKKEWKQIFTTERLHSLGPAEGGIFMGTKDEIFFCDAKNFNLSRIPVLSSIKPNVINVFFTDQHLTTWAGDESGNIFSKQISQPGFEWRGNINNNQVEGTFYPIYSLFVDEKNILWVGADVLGLCKAQIQPPAFSIFPPKEAPALFIHSIYEDAGENVWLGTYRQGLMQLNKRSNQIKKIDLPGKKGTDENSIRLIKKDSHNDLWVGSNSSLYVRRNGSNSFSHIPIPRPEGFAERVMGPMSIHEYGDTLYMSTYWGIYGITRREGDFTAHYYERSGGFYYDIFIDDRKNFWLATEGGIFRRKYLDQFFASDKTDTVLFRNVGIKSFNHDSTRQLLWISTTSGLIAYHLPTGKYRSFSEADGMGNSYVYGCLQDKEELWLSTNKGLSRARINWNKNSVLPELSFINFTQKDGLPDDEFNTGSFYRSSTGNLYFGSIKGVVWFRPQDIRRQLAFPSIIMTGLLVNEEKADSSLAPEFTRKLSLPYYRNNLFLKFRGIDYANPDKVQYAYQLEGWDKNWVYSGTLDQVRYNNLPAGHYSFKVKASNGEGGWGEEAYTISIDISPPFWKTTWFLLLVTVTLLTLILLLARYIYQNKLKQRIRELEKEKALEEERKRISREIHDDIGAGLTQITLMSESAKNKSDVRELDDIAGISRNLVGSMSEIIWSMNTEQKTLGHFFYYLREQLHKQLEYANIDYSIEFPENGHSAVLSNEQRRNLFLATKEIVNNAIKYSRAGNIIIKAKQQNGDLSFMIEDDGIGFDAAQSFSGNGLRNIRKRISDLGGEMHIISAKGSGSKFQFNVPLN